MSNHQLANPFSGIIAAAKKTRPTGEVARVSARVNARGSTQLILCDASSSMSESAGGGQKRIDHLRSALGQLWQPAHKIIVFNTSALEIAHPSDLPEASGGTALEIAIQLAQKHNPASTLIISDGEPNQPALCLELAKSLPGIINVLYCGEETNTGAIQFMRDIARVGCGCYTLHSWRAGQPALANNIKPLLLR